MSHYCRTCRQPVETYRPAGAPHKIRALRHPESAYGVGGYQCTGSFDPVDDEQTVQREAERTERWQEGEAP